MFGDGVLMASTRFVTSLMRFNEGWDLCLNEAAPCVANDLWLYRAESCLANNWLQLIFRGVP